MFRIFVTMETINRLFSVVGFFLTLLILIAFNVLIGLFFLSLAIVPATWLWAKLTNQSYFALIYTSNMLYKINIFGQWAWLITVCISITYFVFWQLIF